MSEKVSVIIPVYNVQKYIDVCVESVCKQSYTNLEIILVNDGSVDSSGEKCDKWKKQDARIKVIHKINGGLSSARNAGLDIATGTYVYFLDSDDYIEPDLIEKVIPFMERGYDLVSFCYNAIYENGEHIFINQPQYGSFLYNSALERQKFLINIFLCGRIGWAAWSRIYRRDVIERYNIRFADNRKIFAEDLYFCLCYCSHVQKVISTDMVLYNYRKRQDSIMGQQVEKLNVGRMNELGKEVLRHYSMHKDCEELIKIFPAIYFMIIFNVLDTSQKKMSASKLREVVKKDITDYAFFEETLKNITNYRYILREAYTSRAKLEKMFSIVQYIIDGKYFLLQIRLNAISLITKILQIVRK